MHAVSRRANGLRVLFLLACVSCAGSRSLVVRHDDGRSSTGEHARGMREGTWTERYASGAKQSEGRYADDAQTGLWIYWFESGQKEMEGSFADERRDGEWKQWHENGALRAEGRFERGFEEGWWRFYDGSGALEREGEFELGKPVLRWTYFRRDGSVSASGNYLAGIKVGEWTSRDASGAQTKIVYPLSAGCELVEEQFSDASLKRAGFVRDATPSGRWISRHPSGKLRLECTFERGEPNGRARAWRDDGSLLASGSLKSGCIAGDWFFARGASVEKLTFEPARPRQSFSGEWSPASSADLAGCTSVETWVAEMCSPRQPEPIRSEPVKPVEPPAALAPSELAGIPARAQPWTEYEAGALRELVKTYGRGASGTYGRDTNARDDENGSAPIRHMPASSQRTISTPSDHADLVGRPLPLKRFTSADGSTIDLDDLVGKRNVLVTILRGFGGQVCVYCAAQTKGLADYADEFAALETEVVVVYPGPASGLDAFLEAYRRTFGAGEKLPYKLLYDTDLALTRALHIEDNIAVPTSIIIDRKGIVRWCHVAKDYADRPSAKSVLAEIEEMRASDR
jgi:antitoxin component YwqK of YwqJK toxin-antitoxin module/peroxiredoxin